MPSRCTAQASTIEAPHCAGDLARLHRQSERVLGVGTEVGQARQPIQRLGLADLVALGTRDDTRLQGVLPSGRRICFLGVGSALQQLLHRRRGSWLCRRDSVGLHVSPFGTGRSRLEGFLTAIGADR